MSEDEADYEQCQRCGREAPPEWIFEITLQDKWLICDSCVEQIEEGMEEDDWRDRYTEEHHDRAVSLLSERDEIHCVISDYNQAAIVVHTPYVSADVVVDFCRHFGFRITDFKPMWQEESEWPCAQNHGDSFEIVLKYLPDSPEPSLVDAIFTPNRIGDLNSNDKQF